MEMALVDNMASVLVDTLAIEQAGMNLAVNAQDAMLQDGSRLKETARVSLYEAYAATHSRETP
ncbi:MAG: hypothetical protein ACUVWY_01100 [Desulfosoma sp.]|uniref:hypothetical protein n=1 Tax=Desulfosoma sp. TaxID=2603217 RepID=UPI004048EEFE